MPSSRSNDIRQKLFLEREISTFPHGSGRKLNRRIYLTIGGVFIFAAGSFLLSWQRGLMPWESRPQPARGSIQWQTGTPQEIEDLPNPFTKTPPLNQIPTPGVTPEALLQDLARQGDLLFEARRYSQTIPLYRAALEKNPGDADTWNDIGLALHYVDKSPDVFLALKKATALQPQFQRAWLSLGYIAIHLKRNNEAKSALERAIIINATSEVAIEARKYLKQLK